MSPLEARTYHLKAVRGFTLIELLVVIAIIGILASVILASLGTARDKALDAAIKENMLSIRTAAALYFSDNGNYGDSFNDDDCPDSGINGDKMFYDTGGPQIDPQINHLIQQSELLYGGSFTGISSARCQSDSTTKRYAVAMPMRIQDAVLPTNIKYFCVDSNGTAKIVYTSIAANAISASLCS